MDAVEVRPYESADEEGWLRCRVLSFLGSAYYDDVRREKEHYENPSIELVAAQGGEIVGLMDVECEEKAGTVCSERDGLGGMIWHVAVHPDHQRAGIATALLHEAERRAAERDIVRLEAWTRDDAGAQTWYETRGFVQLEGYLHVYVALHDGLREIVSVADPPIRPVSLFAHYTGDDHDAIKGRFERVHDCVLYERRFAGRE